MRVGILGGTGPLGRGLALRLAATGVPVTVGSRDPVRASRVVEDMVDAWGERAAGIDSSENWKAASADVVVAATPWEAAVPTVVENSRALEGKVVVSVGNALVREGREMLALSHARGSVASAIQAALPASEVVSACQHLPATTLVDLDQPIESDVLVCSDHQGSKTRIMELLGRISGFRALDAGSLAASGAIEAFTAVLVTLNIHYKAHSTLRIGGLEA